jgi:hypothetical protein
MRALTRHLRSSAALPALLAAAMLALAACGGGSGGATQPRAAESEPPAAVTTRPSREATLADLASVDDLRDRFDADAGQARLLLLLSPT